MNPTDLGGDPQALRRIFLGLGLAQPGESVVGQALAGGVSSGIYRVDLAAGSFCVKQALPQLKVAKEWKVPVERVFAEVGYLRVAHGIVPGHVPRVLGLDEATKSFVMPFLGAAGGAGQPQGARAPSGGSAPREAGSVGVASFRNWKGLMLAGEVPVDAGRAMGGLLGRIHAATADDDALAREFANDADFHAIRLEPYLVETARVHPALADRLLAMVARTASTRRVLVHGDVSPKNVLLGPDGPVLLDAECAWFGDPAFDLAFCLNHFLLKLARRPADSDALMASFGAMKRAYFAHVAWEEPAALEARAASLLPALALARVDGKSPVEYLDTATAGAVREAAMKLLQGAPSSLDVIAAAWAWEFNS